MVISWASLCVQRETHPSFNVSSLYLLPSDQRSLQILPEDVKSDVYTPGHNWEIPKCLQITQHSQDCRCRDCMSTILGDTARLLRKYLKEISGGPSWGILKMTHQLSREAAPLGACPLQRLHEQSPLLRLECGASLTPAQALQE